MDQSAQDIRHVKNAIRLAQVHSLAGHGGPFGALIVANDKIVARGWNKVTSSHDPTAHAEIVAIRAASRKLHLVHLSGCVLYTSCEPCPMCLAACYWARLDRVVFGAERADAAAIGFSDDFIYREIPLGRSDRSLHMTQLLRNEAREVMGAWHADSNRATY